MSTVNRTLSIRKSCQFCRSRKIKCSGQAKCEACMERNLDCVYAPESAKGRPRRTSASLASRVPPQPTIDENEALDTSQTDASYTIQTYLTEAQQLNAKTFERWTRIESPSSWNPDFSVAQDIALFFRQEFQKEVAPSGDNPYLRAISTFSDKANAINDCPSPGVVQSMNHPGSNNNGYGSPSIASNYASPSSPDSMDIHYKAPALSYDGVLTYMAQEVVEMVSIMYGKLGVQHLDDSPGKFYVKIQISDTTTQMFPDSVIEGTATQKGNPMARFEQHQLLQMVESWFTLHPLASIVSKTLFLRQYKDRAHDEVLLSLMIGDALYIGDGKVGSDAGEPFFDYACALLGLRKTEKFSLSVLQSCLLLSWHCLCIGKGRKATAFASWACAGTNKTMMQLNDKPITGMGKINGIDIGEVETECLKNMNSVLSLLTLWGFMQFNQPYADFLPSIPLATESLPRERSNSVVAQLDEKSGNLSTRSKQDRMIKELWVLSNITATVSHIYALYPRKAAEELDEETQKNSFLVSVNRLKGINNQNIPLLCSRIGKVLEEAVRDLTLKFSNGDIATNCVTLVAYYVIMIHLLFPRTVEEDGWTVTANTIDKFFNIGSSLVKRVQEYEGKEDNTGSDQWLFSRALLPPTSSEIAISNMILLGIDACARGMAFFASSVELGTWQESQLVLLNRARFLVLADEMLQACKFTRLAYARRLKEVKKYIKTVKKTLGEWSVLNEPSPPVSQIMPQQTDRQQMPTYMAPNHNFDFGTTTSSATHYTLDQHQALDLQNLNFTDFGDWNPELYDTSIEQHDATSLDPSPAPLHSLDSPNFMLANSNEDDMGTTAGTDQYLGNGGTVNPSVLVAKIPTSHEFQDFSFESYNMHFPDSSLLWQNQNQPRHE